MQLHVDTVQPTVQPSWKTWLTEDPRTACVVGFIDHNLRGTASGVVRQDPLELKAAGEQTMGPPVA